MKKIKLLFKYDAKLGDKSFKAGSVHELSVNEVELARLTRQGCIFAPKDAELTVKEKPKRNTRKKEQEVEDVDYQILDQKPAELQTDESDEK